MRRGLFASSLVGAGFSFAFGLPLSVPRLLFLFRGGGVVFPVVGVLPLPLALSLLRFWELKAKGGEGLEELGAVSDLVLL